MKPHYAPKLRRNLIDNSKGCKISEFLNKVKFGKSGIRNYLHTLNNYAHILNQYLRSNYAVHKSKQREDQDRIVPNKIHLANATNHKLVL